MTRSTSAANRTGPARDLRSSGRIAPTSTAGCGPAWAINADVDAGALLAFFRSRTTRVTVYVPALA